MSMNREFPAEATPDDVQALWDAINVTLSPDAMHEQPGNEFPDPFGVEGTEFPAGSRHRVELIPIEG
jgi:hypothetical protein